MVKRYYLKQLIISESEAACASVDLSMAHNGPSQMQFKFQPYRLSKRTVEFNLPI